MLVGWKSTKGTKSTKSTKSKIHKTGMYAAASIIPAASVECRPHLGVHVACSHYEKCLMQRAAEAFFAFHYISGEAQPKTMQ